MGSFLNNKKNEIARKRTHLFLFILQLLFGTIPILFLPGHSLFLRYCTPSPSGGKWGRIHLKFNTSNFDQTGEL